jgi:cytochrome c peroxidase
MQRLPIHVLSSISVAAMLAQHLAQTAQPSEPIVPIPLGIASDAKRAAIGERLFHDRRVSKDQNESCATCHPLKQGGMDSLPVAVRPDGSKHLRNTPTVFNVGLSAAYNWDGIANTLEAHADRIVQTLMKMTWVELIARLSADPAYVSSFKAAYEDGVTRPNILDALAVFEMSLLTPNSRFDRFLRNEHNAMTQRETRGYRLFKRYGCVTCHQGTNMGGNLYQKFGVFEDVAKRNVPPFDQGRIRITNVPRDEQVFRVPSLRNVAVTAPYFHDGREQELPKAVETMGKVQLGQALPREDVDLIVEFLRTLTGEFRGAVLSAPSGEAVQ